MRDLAKSIGFILFFIGVGLGLVKCSPHETQDQAKNLDTRSMPQKSLSFINAGLRIPSLGPVPELPEWADNPLNDAKKELGKAIFFDPRLSGSGTMVCGGCHPSNAEFQSGTPLDLPDRSFPELSPSLHRNAPSLLNIVFAPMMRWDGSHFTNLYELMVLPFAEANMNLSKGIPAHQVDVIDIASAQEILREKFTVEARGYVPLFRDAFGVNIDQLSAAEIWTLTGKALAVHIRVAVSRDAAFDRWNAGDDAALTEGAKRGLELFTGRARCIGCHNGPLFSDFKFHNMSTSVPDSTGRRADEGRYLVTGLEQDRGAFLTPTLRSVARTSPYLHDGSVTAIAKVIKHFTTELATRDPLHDPMLKNPPKLSDAEIADLVAFLKSLDGKAINREALRGPASLP